jgi:hypothetical protein
VRTVPGRCGWPDRGFGTVEYLAAVGISLILLVMVANVIVVQYGRGVLRAAVDEGVRDGSRYFADEELAAVEGRCEHRAREVLHNLLRGRMGRGLEPRCRATDSDVTAVIEGRFEGWLPGIPDFDATTRGAAARERPF